MPVRQPVTSTGPPLGNVPTADSYLRIKQNIESLQVRLQELSGLVQQARPLTAQQIKQIQQELQAQGQNPLNLQALPGVAMSSVSSVNGVKGAVLIAAGSGITVTNSGQTITVAAAPPGPWTAYVTTIGHLSTITVNNAAYQQAGKTTFLRICIAGTSDGTPPTFTSPASPFTGNQTLACTITTLGVTVPGWVTMSGTTLNVGFYDNRAWVNTQAYSVVMTGVYEAS